MNYEIKKYPDGTSYVELIKSNNGIFPKFVFKLNSYEDLWHLNQVVEAYNHKGFTPIVTIPYLIDAQADRRFADNQSSGLKLVCKFLNSMNATFEIFHPHNAEVVEALMDNVVIIDNHRYITQVLFELGREFPDRLEDEYFKTKQNFFIDKRVVDNTVLMSADAGGFKPLMKLCDTIGWSGEVYSASKSRIYQDGETYLHQIIDRDDFDGKNILIVDDLSIRGGTFKGLAKKLRDKNVGKLYLAVSHITLEDLGKDPVTNYFDIVFTTNSKFNNYYAPDGQGGTQPSNIHIINKFQQYE